MQAAIGQSDSVDQSWTSAAGVIKSGRFSLSQLSASSLGPILSAEAPALVLGFVSPELDFDAVIAPLREVFPSPIPMVLSSTAGELCNCAPGQSSPYCSDEGESVSGGVVLQTFSKRLFGAVRTITVALGNEDIRAGKSVKAPAQRVRAIAQQLASITLPFQIDYRDTFAYALVDGLSNSESFFMEAVYESGAFPCLLVGGSAGGKLDFQDTYIYDGTRKRQGCAVVTLIKVAEPFRFGILKSHNFERAAHSFVILGCDPTARTVTDALDEKAMERQNFADALCAALGCDIMSLEERLTDYSFGVEIDGEIYVRSVAAVDKVAKTVRFYCDIDVGDRLWLLKRTDFVSTTDRHFAEYSVGKPRPVGGILNDCILRRLFNGPSLPSLSAFKGIPLAGFSTFGELLGVNINQTLTAIFFHDVSGGAEFRDKYVDSFLLRYAAFKGYFLERKLSQGEIVKGLYGKVLARIFENTPILRDLIASYTEALEELGHYLGYLNLLTGSLGSVSSAIGTASSGNASIYSQVQSLAANIKEINAIAATVAEIAEQTNILSINAAIQAVRAGEHGKAFAVVATEVRKLSVETQKNVQMINATAKSIVSAVGGIETKTAGERKHLDAMVSANADILKETDRIIAEISEAKRAMERKHSQNAQILAYLQEIENSEALIRSMLGTR